MRNLIENILLNFDLLLLHVACLLVFYAQLLSENQLYVNSLLIGNWSILHLCDE